MSTIGSRGRREVRPQPGAKQGASTPPMMANMRTPDATQDLRLGRMAIDADGGRRSLGEKHEHARRHDYSEGDGQVPQGAGEGMETGMWREKGQPAMRPSEEGRDNSTRTGGAEDRRRRPRRAVMPALRAAVSSRPGRGHLNRPKRSNRRLNLTRFERCRWLGGRHLLTDPCRACADCGLSCADHFLGESLAEAHEEANSQEEGKASCPQVVAAKHSARARLPG